jgi:hypothetical protein
MDQATAMVAASIGVAAASEIIGMSKMKDNSVVELILRILMMVFPKVKK